MVFDFEIQDRRIGVASSSREKYGGSDKVSESNDTFCSNCAVILIFLVFQSDRFSLETLFLLVGMARFELTDPCLPKTVLYQAELTPRRGEIIIQTRIRLFKFVGLPKIRSIGSEPV